MKQLPNGPRKRVLVQLRVEVAERARWARAAAAESVRLGELCREAIRSRVFQLEQHRLLARTGELDGSVGPPKSAA
jgi:hypothetical protein